MIRMCKMVILILLTATSLTACGANSSESSQSESIQNQSQAEETDKTEQSGQIEDCSQTFAMPLNYCVNDFKRVSVKTDVLKLWEQPLTTAQEMSVFYFPYHTDHHLASVQYIVAEDNLLSSATIHVDGEEIWEYKGNLYSNMPNRWGVHNQWPAYFSGEDYFVFNNGTMIYQISNKTIYEPLLPALIAEYPIFDYRNPTGYHPVREHSMVSFEWEDVTKCSLSPDGKKAAFDMAYLDEDTNVIRCIFIYDMVAETWEPIQIDETTRLGSSYLYWKSNSEIVYASQYCDPKEDRSQAVMDNYFFCYNLDTNDKQQLFYEQANYAYLVHQSGKRAVLGDFSGHDEISWSMVIDPATQECELAVLATGRLINDRYYILNDLEGFVNILDIEQQIRYVVENSTDMRLITVDDAGRTIADNFLPFENADLNDHQVYYYLLDEAELSR